MPVRIKVRAPPLRVLLFALLLLSGLIPLLVVDSMLVTAVPRDGRLLETAAIVAGGGLLVAGLAWTLSGWAAAAVVEPTRRLSEALAGIAEGRLEGFVGPDGAVRELAELSDDLNRMTALTLKRVQALERSKLDNAKLASDAMRLFQQAVQAREPLTRHHPGLLHAYTRAVARQLGDRAEELESAEIALSPFPDPARKRRVRDTRDQPRFPVDDLMLESPVAAKILDVSSLGMKLETMEGLPLGRQDTFGLVARSGTLSVPGRVGWCRLVRTIRVASGDLAAVYRAGVAFDPAAAAASRDELSEIIRDHRQVAHSA